MSACATKCASQRGVIPSRQGRSSIAKRSRRPKLGANAASTGEKKIKGRKRHILVDTMGNLLLVLVHSAGWSDLEGGTWLLLEALQRFCHLLKIWADKAYRGDLSDDLRALFGVDLEIVQREPGQRGFVVQPRRWGVERSFGWYSRNRRLSKDYERLCQVSEAMVYIASIQILVKRLRPDPYAPRPYLRPSG
jgi:putative transposase